MSPMTSSPDENIDPAFEDAVERRAADLLAQARRTIACHTDRLFAGLLAVECLVGIVVALWVSPRTWAGLSSRVHPHVWAALVLGPAVVGFPIALAFLRCGSQLTRHVVGIAQMLMGGLLIQFTGGRIETHFIVFGSLAFLSFYRDWPVLVSSSVVVALDHLLRGLLWPESVYGVLTPTLWRSFEHAGWVLFIDFFLISAARRAVAEMAETARRRAQLESAHQWVERQVVTRTAELQASTEDLGRALSILKATLDSTTDGILVVSGDGEVLARNRRFAEMWRIPQSILESQDDSRTLEHVIGQLKDSEKFLARVRALYADSDAESFDLLEFKDGRTFERYSQAHRAAGASAGRVWSFRDVTERRRIEEELRQSQKLEAIGQLAGGVAHDFNNLLTAISGYGELLGRQIVDQPGPCEALEEIQSAAKRAAGLTRQLLAFSRRQMLAPLEINLSTVVTGMEKMLRRLLGGHIDVRVVCAPDLGTIRADLSQIEQVILNLAVNARDAMTAGGTLSIEAINSPADDPAVRPHAEWSPTGHVILRVTDTGCGMSEDVQKRIFDPFFTTKQPGQGTGLGLSTVHGIVAQSGGAIWVESTSGRGSVFTVALPRIEGHRVELAQLERNIRSGQGGTETVLVAEDDPAVRRLVSATLQSCGYTVLEAADGQKALEAWRAHSGSIDLLLTDVVMPNMGGFELVSAVKRCTPSVRVLYMSGHTGVSALPPTNACATAFVAKPFTARDLMAKVREVLDAPEGALGSSGEADEVELANAAA